MANNFSVVRFRFLPLVFQWPVLLNRTGLFLWEEPKYFTTGGENAMYLTVQEMTLLCTFYADTISATLELLRSAENERPEIKSVVDKLVEKMENMKKGDNISLYFESD
jgi:hypothetical protein